MIKLRFNEGIEIPAYQTQHSAGCDLAYNGKEDLVIQGLSRENIYVLNSDWNVIKVSTGVFIEECPENVYLDLRLRSSVGKKFRLASSGLIDADYRDEILIPIQNMTLDKIIIKPGERIAQLIATPFISISGLERKGVRTGGFGSTN